MVSRPVETEGEEYKCKISSPTSFFTSQGLMSGGHGKNQQIPKRQQKELLKLLASVSIKIKAQTHLQHKMIDWNSASDNKMVQTFFRYIDCITES